MKKLIIFALFAAAALVCCSRSQAQVIVIANPGVKAVEVSKDDPAYRAGWRSLVFSGQASMPKSLDGDAAIVDFVAHNAGAIGYIAKASPHEGVKVLAVK